jgi:hypothetical protein
MRSQILFLTCVLVLAGYTASNRLLATWLKRIFLGALACVALVICWPALSTKVANLLGIGRGVDFLIYLAFFGVFFSLLSTHVRIRKLEALVTQLARNIALQSANDQKVPKQADRGTN